jgi:hypothetical protein
MPVIHEDDFVAEMERRFGSDAALGVTFELCNGQRLSAAEFDAMVKAQSGHIPDSVSYLPTGGSAVCCTDYAELIYLALPGRVQIFGFANEDNPTSRVAREAIHLCGHDFAVVDGRYIVDPWPRLVPAEFDQMVFDMQDPQEAATVLDIYGPRECWTRMYLAEAHAATLELPA